MADFSKGNQLRQEAQAAGALAGASPFGSIYYVDSVNGNDGNNGYSQDNALKTLTRAAALASAGDTIILDPGGTETVTAAIAVSAARVRIVCPVDNARSGYAISGAGTLDLISVTAADVHIEGLQLKHTGATANASGILASAAASRLTVRNCVFDDMVISSTKTGVGVELTAGADDQVVDNCDFLDVKYGVQIVASSTNESDRPVVKNSTFHVGGTAFFGVYAAAGSGKVQAPRIIGNHFIEADGDGSSATAAWDGTNGANATQGPISFGAAVDQYLIADNYASTASAALFDNLNGINAGAAGELVNNATATTSSVATVASDTTVIESDSIVIESSIQVVEAGYTATYSDTTIIASDVVIVVSDTTAIHTQTTVIASDTKVIESDLIATQTTVGSIYSDTAIIYSDTDDIHSDTTIIASDVVILVSDTTAIHTQTTAIASDCVIVESNSIVIESDIIVVKSDVDNVESASVVLLSDSLITESNSVVIESDVIVIKSDVDNVESASVVLLSDSLITESNSVVIESDVIVIKSDAAELCNWDVRTAVKTGLALDGGAVADVFTIANGPIELIALVTHVTTAVSAHACTAKWELDPTVGASNTDLCNTVDIISAAQGDAFYIVGASASAMVKAANGTAVPLAMAASQVLMPGGIDLSLANADPSTGAATVYLVYRPLAVNATVTPAV